LIAIPWFPLKCVKLIPAALVTSVNVGPAPGGPD